MKEIFTEYVKSSEAVAILQTPIGRAMKEASIHHDIENKLYSKGLEKNHVALAMNSMEIMYGLNYFNVVLTALKDLSDAQKYTNGVIDIWNKIVFLDSLDKDAMLKYAQVYLGSSDEEVQTVGRKLKSYYSSDMFSRVAMICGDELFYKMVDKILSEVVKKIKEGMGAVVGSGFAVVITATNFALDNLAGVGKLPDLMSNLQYSSEMTDGVYEVFLKRLEEYKKTPTDELFEETYWAFMTYCNVAKLGEKAFVEIYNTVGKTVLGGLFITDEAEKVVQWSGEIADNIGRLMADANAAYNWRNTGDYESFVEAIEKIHSETYITPYPGGGSGGGGAW